MASGQSRPDPHGELAHDRRPDRNQDRQREQREPRLHRRIADRLDQHIRHQQHRRAERSVEQEGHQVQPDEAAVGEHRQRHHRPIACAALDPQEQRQHREAADDRDDGGRIGRARRRPARQAVGRAAKPRRGEEGAGIVGPARTGVPALTDEDQCEGDRPEAERDVDVEDRGPTDIVDQPPAEQRRDRSRRGSGRRPDSDGAPALLSLIGSVEQSQAVGQQQRRANTLRRPRGKQEFRDSAPGRRGPMRR